MTPFAKRISIAVITLSLIFCCFVVTVSATNLPKVGIYHHTDIGYYDEQSGLKLPEDYDNVVHDLYDYTAEIEKFFQCEHFGDDIAANLSELESRYDIIVFVGYEDKMPVEIESNLIQFVNDGGGLFVAGVNAGLYYMNGTMRSSRICCSEALGFTSTSGLWRTSENVTFDSNITDSIFHPIGTLSYRRIKEPYTGDPIAWTEDNSYVVGTKNEYGSGRAIYFSPNWIGEGEHERNNRVNFSGRDEFILKTFNWLAGGNLSEPQVYAYPLPNNHNAVLFFTIDDSVYDTYGHDKYYDDFLHEEVFEWEIGKRWDLDRHPTRTKSIVDTTNTVVVGLHNAGDSDLLDNTSKSPEECQADAENYIIDARNKWSALGYDTPISGWRTSKGKHRYDSGADMKFPIFPALNNSNITWISSGSQRKNEAQFPFNVVSNPAYGDFNKSITYPLIQFLWAQSDLAYKNAHGGSYVGWANDSLIPAVDAAMVRHSVVTVLTHANYAWSSSDGVNEVQELLNYTKDKDVLFSDHDTFTNFWNARNNVNLSYSGGNITVQAQDAIRGLTLKSKENISSAKIGDDYLIFVKGDRVVLPEIEAGDTLNVTIQNGSYNTSIPRISSITTTHPIYVLNATYNPTDKKVSLTLDLPYLYKSIYGSKPASVSIENFNHPFLNAGITTVSPANNLTIYINLSGETNIASVDMSVNPSISPVNITINNLSFPQSINFTASSANGNNVTFTIRSLVPKGKYVIKRDDNYFMTKIADDCGCIEFNNSEWSKTYTFTVEFASEFDTGPGTYPSIMGIHNGTITPSCNIIVLKMYTYPCEGTGGHTEYVELRNETFAINATWNGYKDDWHNITFPHQFILLANHTYNYTIKTGSYPQIIHEHEFNATGGKITCTEFINANGRKHNNWIPAIRLMIG